MTSIVEHLGDEAESLLTHTCQGIPKGMLQKPGPDYVGHVFSQTDRHNSVLRNYQSILNNGRLAGTGYVSILLVDQAVVN